MQLLEKIYSTISKLLILSVKIDFTLCQKQLSRGAWKIQGNHKREVHPPRHLPFFVRSLGFTP